MASEKNDINEFFKECMKCRNCERMYLMKERKWLLRCSKNRELFTGQEGQPWFASTDVVLPDKEMKDKCNLYAERLMMNWSKEEKEND